MQFSRDIKAVLSAPFFKWGKIGHPYKISYKFIDHLNGVVTKLEPADVMPVKMESVFPFSQDFKTILREKFNEWSKISGIEFYETSRSDHDVFLAYGISSTFAQRDNHSISARVSLDEQHKPYAILFNKDHFDYFSLQQRGYIALHEIGHVIGLGHHYTNSQNLLPEEKSHQNYTVMASFNDFFQTTRYPATPSLLDIEAAQALYGKPHQSFSAIYSLKDTKIGISTLYSDGALKVIDLSGYSGNIILNLNTGYHHPSFIGSDTGFYLYYTEQIHTALTGAGNDVLISNGSNTFTGGAGRNVFQFSAKLCGSNLITDFKIGEDKLKIADYLNGFFVQQYSNNDLTIIVTHCLNIKLIGINALSTNDYEIN